MIDWKKLTDSDIDLIYRIVKRARDLTPNEIYGPIVMSLEMSIQAAHTVCPLDLERWLAADDFNFLHDVFGIGNNFSPRLGQFKDCFVPRYAK